MNNKFFIIAILITTTILGNMKAQDNINILVYSKTNGFRHDAIPHGIEALKKLGEKNGWECIFTEDSLKFNEKVLNSVDVIVFLFTTGDVLDENQQKLFKKYIENGGGFVGFHSATITETDWDWYGNLIGAYFTGHPPTQKGKLIVEDSHHPATEHMKGDAIEWEEEWYSFDRNPRANVQVLLSVDEDSYDVDNNEWFEGVNQRMGDHPIAWCHENANGRVFQTALGHRPESLNDPFIIKHLEGAILWAAKKKD